jgi:hypothetical protein
MERDEVTKLKAVDSQILPTGHMSIQEEPAKVAAFIESAAKRLSSK